VEEEEFNRLDGSTKVAEMMQHVRGIAVAVSFVYVCTTFNQISRDL